MRGALAEMRKHDGSVAGSGETRHGGAKNVKKPSKEALSVVEKNRFRKWAAKRRSPSRPGGNE